MLCEEHVANHSRMEGQKLKFRKKKGGKQTNRCIARKWKMPVKAKAAATRDDDLFLEPVYAIRQQSST